MQRLIGAAAMLGGAFGIYLNLSKMLRASSPADLAFSAVLLALWLLAAIAGLLILVASFLGGGERAAQGRKAR